MSKGWRIILAVLLAFMAISFLHVWLNIGFEKLGLFRSSEQEASFRVGFLPVT
jgi:hypothetical protein